jgi:hypothetical protein
MLLIVKIQPSVSSLQNSQLSTQSIRDCRVLTTVLGVRQARKKPGKRHRKDMAAQNNAPLPDGLDIAGYRIVKKIAYFFLIIVYLA